MANVTTNDLRAAYNMLSDHLMIVNDPAVQRAADWLLSQIETRNIRKVAREHNEPMVEMRALIADAEQRGMI